DRHPRGGCRQRRGPGPPAAPPVAMAAPRRARDHDDRVVDLQPEGHAVSGRGVLWALCAACAGLVACALGSPAMAQSGEDEQEGLSLQPELGFDGVYLYGRWAPITVWSTAHTPMSGELSVRYGLAPTQPMRFATGFAATPGELAPAQLAAPMPNWLDEVEIDAIAVDAAGKRWTGGVTMSS